MRHATFLHPVAALLALVLGSTQLAGWAVDLDPPLKAFLEAANPEARRAAVAEVLAASPDPLDVEWGLRRGRVYPSVVKHGWQVFENNGLDGKARSYHVDTPKTYDPARKHPVNVSLHGGVSTGPTCCRRRSSTRCARACKTRPTSTA